MKITTNRVDSILPYIKGEVLNIGCVGMGENDIIGGVDFVHDKIKKLKRVSSLTGIDINKKELERYNKKGFNIIYQSADKPFAFKNKFDTIIAEEIIDHLLDFNTFFSNVKNNLKDEGTFILTSPNPLSFDFILQNLLFKKTLINRHHTHWHSPETIKCLAKLFDFKITKVKYYSPVARNLRGKLFQFTLGLILPSRFGRCIIYIMKKK